MSGQVGSKVSRNDVLRMTVRVAAAYVAKSSLESDQLPALLHTVHDALSGLGEAPEAETRQVNRRPAVSISKSVAPNYIVCLEDGRRLKMLKRHLKAAYGLSPEEYRQRWNLPSDYPMVAPKYAEQRSKFAKQMGLGRTRRGKPVSGS